MHQPPGGGNFEVTIVDFEYANAGQPLMDLAVLSMGCALSASEERRLLACYLQKESVSDAEAARFVTLKMLATLRETFWGVTAEVSKTSALSDEAAAAYTDEVMPSTSRRARSTKSCAPCMACRRDDVPSKA